MKNTSGMGWDEATQRPNCSENVWKNYVKANPNALKFRTKGLRNYTQLAGLLEGRQATGEYVTTDFQARKRSNPEDSSEDATSSSTTPASVLLAPQSGLIDQRIKLVAPSCFLGLTV